MIELETMIEQAIQRGRDLHPWIERKNPNGSGALGDVVYLTSFRHRYKALRDFRSVVLPKGVTVYGNTTLIWRCTDPTVSAVIDGTVNMNGCALSPPGPAAPAATITPEPNGFRVSCRACRVVHLAVRGSTLADWAPFVYGFGGEIFMCSCGAESELRLR